MLWRGEALQVVVGNTRIVKRTGEHVPSAAVQAVQEGQEIVVEGKKSKRGVIHATRALIGD